MDHLGLNLAEGGREQAASLLRAATWPLERDERHCGARASDDLTVTHVGKVRCAFIGQAVLATVFRDGGWSRPDTRTGDTRISAVDSGLASIRECWRRFDEYSVVRDLLALPSKGAAAWKLNHSSVWKLVPHQRFHADHVTLLPLAAPDALDPVTD
jgi:hypothetical protein